jgi:transposase-like protein
MDRFTLQTCGDEHYNRRMKRKTTSKEKAALALLKLVEGHMKTLPAEEQERRWSAFELKVAELKKKRAKSSKPPAISRGRRRAQARG